MAVPGTDIDDQWIRGRRWLGQDLAQTLVDSLAHQMFDTRSMQGLNRRSHNVPICDRLWQNVK
jgi:hypothetical protein